MAKVTLSKSLTKDGNEIKELNLDFDKITGNQIVAAEKEARLLGDSTLDISYSKTFQSIIAAKAAVEPVVVDDILDLAGPDFIQVTAQASNFLFGWALLVSAQVKS